MRTWNGSWQESIKQSLGEVNEDFSPGSGEAKETESEKFGCLAWPCYYEQMLAIVTLGTSSEWPKPQVWSFSRSFKQNNVTDETCQKDHLIT